MSPIALTEQKGQDVDMKRYHTQSSDAAISGEAKYAAHNYHPLPVVFSKASGTSVWDPVSQIYHYVELNLKQF
jgi:ornithine--oxo-acid transaminase